MRCSLTVYVATLLSAWDVFVIRAALPDAGSQPLGDEPIATRFARLGKHAERLPGQFVDDGLFDIAERRFTLALEKCPDRATEPLFDDVVGVSEGKPEPAGQLTSDCGFSASGQADQTDHIGYPISGPFLIYGQAGIPPLLSLIVMTDVPLAPLESITSMLTSVSALTHRLLPVLTVTVLPEIEACSLRVSELNTRVVPAAAPETVSRLS